MKENRLSEEHLDTLRQRQAYLGQRVIAKQAVGWDFQYDERERKALEWALARLGDTEDAGHSRPMPQASTNVTDAATKPAR